MYIVDRRDRQGIPIKVFGVQREVVNIPSRFEREEVTWFLIWDDGRWRWVNAIDYSYTTLD